jgi:hypothetical protein
VETSECSCPVGPALHILTPFAYRGWQRLLRRKTHSGGLMNSRVYPCVFWRLPLYGWVNRSVWMGFPWPSSSFCAFGKRESSIIGCCEARQPGGKSNVSGFVQIHTVTVFGDQGSSVEEFLSLQRPSSSRPWCRRNRINLHPDSTASGERGNFNTNPSGGLAVR